MSLPRKACVGHIIPKLAQQSLLSVVKLCASGCTVIFEHGSCSVMYNNKVVMHGKKCEKTGLWLVSLHEISIQKPNIIYQENMTKHHVNNVHHTTSKSELITYLYQCLFPPTKSIILKAVKNDQLLGFPGLTEEAINKHLPQLTETIKGHLHRERRNIRSTTNPN